MTEMNREQVERDIDDYVTRLVQNSDRGTSASDSGLSVSDNSDEVISTVVTGDAEVQASEPPGCSYSNRDLRFFRLFSGFRPVTSRGSGLRSTGVLTPSFLMSFLFGVKVLSNKDERAASQRLDRAIDGGSMSLDSDHILELNGEGELIQASEPACEAGYTQEQLAAVGDPTNHDRLAMHYVDMCIVELSDIQEFTEANRIRADKWISAKLSAKIGLRQKHLRSIKARFMTLLWLPDETDVEMARIRASRAYRDRLRAGRGYSHWSGGFFWFLRPLRSAPVPDRA